ncbi:hypothetical protein CYMTET_35691 [Cymbomonas tetramitiformis]|uniref:Uncharacterized protein n=1 Tax=Cymbomonas tetramitiformis TaxID=36881 RepID=A0AAE0KNV4_9CHLO|nr:hypothetical protein CYMTET_35691 [Cymbomonas tetramitiformis]
MIYEALNRFLKHIPPYCDVIVVLHSALWDVLRYQEHFKRNQDEDAWIAEYQHNLTSYLEGLQTILERHYGSSSRRIMRSVVVKTTPLVDNRDIARPLHKLNQLKRGMAHEYKIFDAALDFKKVENVDAAYLKDHLHQNREGSLRMFQSFLKYIKEHRLISRNSHCKGPEVKGR